MQPREHFIAGYLLSLSTRACAGYMLLFAIPMSVFLFLLIFFSGHRELTHGFWRMYAQRIFPSGAAEGTAKALRPPRQTASAQKKHT